MTVTTIRRPPHDQACALISEQIIEDTLLHYGWGIVQSPLQGTQRLLTLVTDGSVVGQCIAHDDVSQAILARHRQRGEHTLVIDLAGGPAHIQSLLIEVDAWLDAVWQFYATGAVAEPLDWTEAPSVSNTNRDTFSRWVHDYLAIM